jgi:hypothetical protein
MAPIDERHRLEDQPFSYTVTRDQQVFVAWKGKRVATIAGREAERLIARLAGADQQQTQLLLAEVTGNFKHGNER